MCRALVKGLGFREKGLPEFRVIQNLGFRVRVEDRLLSKTVSDVQTHSNCFLVL